MLRRLLLSLSLTLLVTGILRPPSAHAHPQMIQLSIGRNGFDSIIDYSITVEAGHEVDLTLTYADADLSEDNPHDIRIKGPGLEDLPLVHLSKENPVVTITFTPEKTGTLRILCVLPCLGMENLVGGQIKVQKPRATGAPTSLSLDLTPREDGTVLARAKLLDTGGNPISGVPLTFILETSLGGELVLSNPTTMEDGSAVVKVPSISTGNVRILAEFEGGSGLAYAEASSEAKLAGVAMTHRPLPLSAPTAPSVLVLVLLVVLGGVWITYGYVAYQVVRIWRG